MGDLVARIALLPGHGIRFESAWVVNGIDFSSTDLVPSEDSIPRASQQPTGTLRMRPPPASSNREQSASMCGVRGRKRSRMQPAIT